MNKYTFYEPETNQIQLSIVSDKPLSEIYSDCVTLLTSLGYGPLWLITTDPVKCEVQDEA